MKNSKHSTWNFLHISMPLIPLNLCKRLIENIIKPILQMNKFKLTDVKSVAWLQDGYVAELKLEPSCLTPGPRSFLLCCIKRRHGLQLGAICYPHFTERWETRDRTSPSSHILWVAMESELDARSPESAVPALSQWALGLAKWMGIHLQGEVTFERPNTQLSWSVNAPSLDNRELQRGISPSSLAT